MMEAHTNMVYVIGIGFLFLLLHGVRNILGVPLNENLNPAFYALYVNVTMLTVL
jgi:hypothetical protein